MYAIEFETKIINNTINIPSKYSGLDLKHVRIFIVEIEPEVSVLPSGYLEPVEIESYSIIAKRDEIYER